MLLIKISTVVLSLIVTGLGLTSQVRKNRIRKSTEGLSFFYFFILAISYSFWTAYGLVLNDFVLIIPMTLGTIMSWVVVFQFIAQPLKKTSSLIIIKSSLIFSIVFDQIKSLPYIFSITKLRSQIRILSHKSVDQWERSRAFEKPMERSKIQPPLVSLRSTANSRSDS